MGTLKYNLAVSSRVSLQKSANLARQAHLLGQKIAAKGHVLVSPIDLSLAYKVAAGMSHKAGLSIGFSRAANLRYHVVDLQLPTDVYDWIYFSHRTDSALLAEVVSSSQALLLIGAVLENMPELAQALELMLPVGILLDDSQQDNNDLLTYLHSLPLEKQQRIVVHQDPQILLDTLCHMLQTGHKDLDEKLLDLNNRTFKQLLDEAPAAEPSAENLAKLPEDN